MKICSNCQSAYNCKGLGRCYINAPQSLTGRVKSLLKKPRRRMFKPVPA